MEWVTVQDEYRTDPAIRMPGTDTILFPLTTISKRVERGETVGGDSIMGILTLGAGPGSTITVSASGAEAREALDALAALVSGRFGEDD